MCWLHAGSYMNWSTSRWAWPYSKFQAHSVESTAFHLLKDLSAQVSKFFWKIIIWRTITESWGPDWYWLHKPLSVHSVPPWDQGPQEVLPHVRRHQALPRGQRGLHSQGGDAGCPQEQRGNEHPSWLRQEKRARRGRALAGCHRHGPRGEVCGCQWHGSALLQLGPCPAQRGQEGKLCLPVSGSPGQVGGWGVPHCQEIRLWIPDPITTDTKDRAKFWVINTHFCLVTPPT